MGKHFTKLVLISVIMFVFIGISAYTFGVNYGYSNNKETSAAADNKLKDGLYEGESMGYSDNVKTQVKIKGGKIKDITITSQKETPEYYEMAVKIIPKIVKKQSIEVDAIGGATITSNAIKRAVADALRKAGMDVSSSMDSELQDVAERLRKAESEKDKIKKELLQVKSKILEKDNNLPLNSLKDGEYYGQGTGYNGRIKVRATVKGGVINNLEVVEHREDSEYFSKAKAILNKIISSNSLNIDNVSGATYSSTGIKEAVIDALKKAGQSSGTSSNRASENSSDNSALRNRLEALQSQNETYKNRIKVLNEEYSKKIKILQAVIDSSITKKLKDGDYEGTGIGFEEGETKLNVSIKNSKISDIQIVSTDDDKKYFDLAKVVIPKIIKMNSTDVDNVTGATYSVEGIKGAVESSIIKARMAYKDSSDISSGITEALKAEITALKKKIEELLKENKGLQKENKELKEEVEKLKKDKDTTPVVPVDNTPKFDILPEKANGVFKGEGIGHKGKPIKVEVTTEIGKIKKIQVDEWPDDSGEYKENAMKLLTMFYEDDSKGIFKIFEEYNRISGYLTNKEFEKVPEAITSKINKKKIPDVIDTENGRYNIYTTYISGFVNSYVTGGDDEKAKIVDTVSGATRSASGISEAVRNALTK